MAAGFPAKMAAPARPRPLDPDWSPGEARPRPPSPHGRHLGFFLFYIIPRRHLGFLFFLCDVISGHHLGSRFSFSIIPGGHFESGRHLGSLFFSIIPSGHLESGRHLGFFFWVKPGGHLGFLFSFIIPGGHFKSGRHLGFLFFSIILGGHFRFGGHFGRHTSHLVPSTSGSHLGCYGSHLGHTGGHLGSVQTPPQRRRLFRQSQPTMHQGEGLGGGAKPLPLVPRPPAAPGIGQWEQEEPLGGLGLALAGGGFQGVAEGVAGAR